MKALNKDIFFIVNGGKIILWDCKNHRQFAIELAFLERIIELSSFEGKSSSLAESDLDQILKQNNIILEDDFSSDQGWGWDLISKIFHIGTQDIPISIPIDNHSEMALSYVEYLKSIQSTKPNFFKDYSSSPKIILPAPDYSLLQNTTLLDVLLRRKTCRHFFDQPVEIEKISLLLDLTFGINKLTSNGNIIRKYVPSGGSLHPSEAYFLSLNVHGIDPGIYHYKSDSHSLSLINEGDFKEKLPSWFMGQFYSNGLSFGILISTRFDKLWWKYKHSRAYRVGLIDIGHISQNFQLVCTALGLDPWLTGALKDSEINEYLNLDNCKESSMFFIGAGIGDRSSFHPIDQSYRTEILDK